MRQQIRRTRYRRATEALETAVEHAHEQSIPVNRSVVVRAAAAELIEAIEAELSWNG